MRETYDGVKEREVGELEEEWGLMKKFGGECKRCVWKEVCWRLYEEGQRVVE